MRTPASALLILVSAAFGLAGIDLLCYGQGVSFHDILVIAGAGGITLLVLGLAMFFTCDGS